MKTWLKKNKIYFETLSSTFLGVMAAIISVISICLTCRQTNNEELLNQPRLKVSNEIFSYSGGFADSHFVVVTNEGGQLTGFDGQMKTFLKIEYYKKPFNTSAERGVIYIPVLDYFSGQIPTNNFQGIVMQFIGVKNLNLAHNLDIGFKAEFDNQHPMTFLTLVHYLEVKYLNYNGDEITATYSVDRIVGGKKIKLDNNTREIISKWSNKGIYLYRLTSHDIRELIETDGSQYIE